MITLMMLSGRDWDSGSYVLVLGDERDRIRRRHAHYMELAAKKDDLSEVVYWDMQEVYDVSWSDFEPSEVEEAEGQLERLEDERIVRLVDKPSWLRKLARTDACKLHVTDDL